MTDDVLGLLVFAVAFVALLGTAAGLVTVGEWLVRRARESAEQREEGRQLVAAIRRHMASMGRQEAGIEQAVASLRKLREAVK